MDKNIFEQKRSDYRRFGFTLLYLSVFLYLGVLIPGISDTFEHYDAILDAVAARAKGRVVEFGPGKGNLTKKLLENKLEVLPFEPSPEMREIGMRKRTREPENG